MDVAPRSRRSSVPIGLSPVSWLPRSPSRRARLPGMSRSLPENRGAVLPAVRASLPHGSRARALRSLPPRAPVFPAGTRGIPLRRRGPAVPARSEVRRPPANRIGARTPREPVLGRFRGAHGRRRRDSRSALERSKAGARLQPGRTHRESGCPRNGDSASSESLEKDEGAAAPGGAFRGRSQVERRLRLPRSSSPLASGKIGPARRRRPHDRSHRRGRVARAPHRGSGCGGRAHPRAGAVRLRRRPPSSGWNDRNRRLECCGLNRR